MEIPVDFRVAMLTMTKRVVWPCSAREQSDPVHTIDPRSGMKPGACAWTEPVGSMYTPSNVTMPTEVC
jgi:hypothetical protein